MRLPIASSALARFLASVPPCGDGAGREDSWSHRPSRWQTGHGRFDPACHASSRLGCPFPAAAVDCLNAHASTPSYRRVSACRTLLSCRIPPPPRCPTVEVRNRHLLAAPEPRLVAAVDRKVGGHGPQPRASGGWQSGFLASVTPCGDGGPGVPPAGTVDLGSWRRVAAGSNGQGCGVFNQRFCPRFYRASLTPGAAYRGGFAGPCRAEEKRI